MFCRWHHLSQGSVSNASVSWREKRREMSLNVSGAYLGTLPVYFHSPKRIPELRAGENTPFPLVAVYSRNRDSHEATCCPRLGLISLFLSTCMNVYLSNGAEKCPSCLEYANTNRPLLSGCLKISSNSAQSI